MFVGRNGLCIHNLNPKLSCYHDTEGAYVFLSQLQYGAAGTTERIHSALIKCGNERYVEMP